MKKSLPWLTAAVFGLWLVGSLRPSKDPGPFHSSEFGKLPVLLNGRIQPLDSVARNSLLIMRGKTTALAEDGSRVSASDWILRVLMKPDSADALKVFRIDHPELLGLLSLPLEEKHFSFAQIEPRLDDLRRQSDRIVETESGKGGSAQTRTPFEKQVMKLQEGLSIYQRLKISLKPVGSVDLAQELERFRQAIPAGVEAIRAKEAGRSFDQSVFDQFVHQLERFDVQARYAYPLMVPPKSSTESGDHWGSVGNSLLSSAQTGEIHPAVGFYARMASAFVANQPDGFNAALGEYRNWLGQSGYSKQVKKANWEFFFHQLQPFYRSMVFYVAAFVLACAGWLTMAQWPNRAAFLLVAIAFCVHSSGLMFRMVLEGRPPVTNLYSSAIFVGWGAVLLGMILERIYRDGVGNVIATSVGFITLVVAHNLSLDGDTMVMLRAVLDTNFWLATHVVVITLGYSAAFVAGFLAVIYILRGVFTRSLDESTRKTLDRMVYGVVCFTTLFSFLGTVLGGIWADQSWGRFWGWDPKENGALLIVLWNAVILHARWDRLVGERGLMALAVFGNIVTSFSWFGVNMLGVGLHAYGFMDQAFFWLMAFVVSQVIIIGLALLPPKYWVSLRTINGTQSVKSAA